MLGRSDISWSVKVSRVNDAGICILTRIDPFSLGMLEFEDPEACPFIDDLEHKEQEPGARKDSEKNDFKAQRKG